MPWDVALKAYTKREIWFHLQKRAELNLVLKYQCRRNDTPFYSTCTRDESAQRGVVHITHLWKDNFVANLCCSRCYSPLLNLAIKPCKQENGRERQWASISIFNDMSESSAGWNWSGSASTCSCPWITGYLIKRQVSGLSWEFTNSTEDKYIFEKNIFSFTTTAFQPPFPRWGIHFKTEKVPTFQSALCLTLSWG